MVPEEMTTCRSFRKPARVSPPTSNPTEEAEPPTEEPTRSPTANPTASPSVSLIRQQRALRPLPLLSLHLLRHLHLQILQPRLLYRLNLPVHQPTKNLQRRRHERLRYLHLQLDSLLQLQHPGLRQHQRLAPLPFVVMPFKNLARPVTLICLLECHHARTTMNATKIACAKHYVAMVKRIPMNSVMHQLPHPLLRHAVIVKNA